MSKLDQHKKAIEQRNALVAWLEQRPGISEGLAGKAIFWVDGRDASGREIGDFNRKKLMLAITEAWPLIDARMRAMAQAHVDAAAADARDECVEFLEQVKS